MCVHLSFHVKKTLRRPPVSANVIRKFGKTFTLEVIRFCSIAGFCELLKPDYLLLNSYIRLKKRFVVWITVISKITALRPSPNSQS